MTERSRSVHDIHLGRKLASNKLKTSQTLVKGAKQMIEPSAIGHCDVTMTFRVVKMVMP